jgi:hypothetical protein
MRNASVEEDIKYRRAHLWITHKGARVFITRAESRSARQGKNRGRKKAARGAAK